MVKESLDRAGMDAGRKKGFGGKSGMVSWRWWAMILGKGEKNTLGDGYGGGEAGVFYQGGGRRFGNGSDLKFLREEIEGRAKQRIFWREQVVAKQRDF
jgi:hypothetical protein